MGKFILLVTLLTISCNNPNCNWTGGEIIDFGEYCKGELEIKVYEKEGYLKYKVSNKKNEVLIQQDMNISIYQHWGLFLDNKNNFWVLSSDVGGFIWKKDSVNGQYHKRTFYHELTKEEVPLELYHSSLKRFLK